MNTIADQEIVEYLHSVANPKIASHSQGFFKTSPGEYGEGDRFLGIRVPVVRQAVKRFQPVSLETAVKLLHSEFHEIRLFALLSLVSLYVKSDAIRQEAIYQLYIDNTRYINNWDLVDSSAPHIIGKHLEKRDRAVLFILARSNSIWERRIAILSTFHFIRNHDFIDALSILEILLTDHQDLIHKASGWMLREIGKRDLSQEVAFLNTHYQAMPRTMLRYAIEKFEKADRLKYLKSKI